MFKELFIETDAEDLPAEGSVPPGAWTESGLTPALTESSSSRKGMGNAAGRDVAAMLCGWPRV